MPEVSIVLPVYNASATLPAALQSLKQQTFDDFEVIVVDDASPDDSRAIAQADGDPRIRVIARETNGGPGAARNVGFDAALGRWITLLDADDRYRPRRLERLVGAARETGAQMVSDDLLLVAGDDREIVGPAFGHFEQGARVTTAVFAKYDRPLIGGGRQLGYIKPLMDREFLNRHQLRYETAYNCGEDFHLYVRCLLAGAELRFIDEALYEYWQVVGSVSRSPEREARHHEQLTHANASLLREAQMRGDRDGAAALKVRRANIRFMREYARYKTAYLDGRYGAALRHALALPTSPREFAGAVRKWLAKQRSGRTALTAPGSQALRGE